MAKKKVKAELCCPVGLEYKPSLYLDLEGKDVAQITGLEVGKPGEVKVIGTVEMIEKRDRTDQDGKTKTTASIRISDYKVVVLEDEENEFDKMAAEDEADE